MKNLLILVPTLQLGGQERIAAKTADLMSETYNVMLAVFDNSDAVYSVSCRVINLDIPSCPGILNKTINVLKRVKAIKALQKEYQIDIIYSFGTSANIVNCLTSKAYRLVSLHGFVSTKFQKWEQALYKRADIIFCVSKLIKHAIDGKYSNLSSKTSVLNNPYDFGMMRDRACEVVDDYIFSSHTIVSHGRLTEIKNWPRLIKAFSVIKKEVSDAQLLIIGEGEKRQELEALISKYGLQTSVTLLGYRNNPFAYIARSTVYALSSYSEGFPNSLVEGMAFLPVVSVDCKSGPREILNNGSIDRVTKGYEISNYGILVQPASDRKRHDEIIEDDEMLAAAILKVLKDKDLAVMLKSGACKRAEEFSCERYTAKLSEILK